MNPEQQSPEYSNRELDRMFKDITDMLDRIEKQTTQTNGSVANLKLWRAYTTGAVAVLTTLLLPCILLILSHYL